MASTRGGARANGTVGGISSDAHHAGRIDAHPAFPQDGEYYRRVLDHVPTPIVVLDDQARVVYANLAAIDLGGWSPEQGVGMSTMDRIHPDDRGWAAEVFASVVDAREGRGGLEHRRWGSVTFRMLAADGTVVPLEVTGANGLADPVVQGIIYDLRPAWGSDLMDRVLGGLAHGAPVEHLLRMVTGSVVIPPVEAEVAMVDHTDAPRPTLVVATDDDVGRLFAVAGAPWCDPAPGPEVIGVADLAPPIGDPLREAGFDTCWWISTGTSHDGRSTSIVASAADGDRYTKTLLHRLRRARDLAAVVQVRAQHDALLVHAATHDALTQVANRQPVYERLQAACEAEEQVALLYLDLDGFKPVNDRYGHATGDALLQAVAGRLRGCTRPTDLVARLGGDEFGVVLGAPADPVAAERVAERIHEALDPPVAIEGLDLRVSASIGIVVAPTGLLPDRLLAEADAAMYEAKRSADRATALRTVTAERGP